MIPGLQYQPMAGQPQGQFLQSDRANRMRQIWQTFMDRQNYGGNGFGQYAPFVRNVANAYRQWSPRPVGGTTQAPLVPWWRTQAQNQMTPQRQIGYPKPLIQPNTNYGL